MVQKKYIIFSDLDGTLLDHNTYSFSAAVDALNLIRKTKVSLVLVSSKTKPELLYYQKILGLEGFPFVVENGAAIYTTPRYFYDFEVHQESDQLWFYQHGPHYQDIVSVLNQISEKYAYPIRGFHNASVDEIAERTGLGDERVRTAMEREFSVPVFFDQKTEQILKKEIPEYNLKLLYGGRFMHVLGDLDKGTAVKSLITAYRKKYPELHLIFMAIGDSQNDLAMLEHVDFPALVMKPNGKYESSESGQKIHYSPKTGPAGWNQSVIEFLNAGGNNE